MRIKEEDKENIYNMFNNKIEIYEISKIYKDYTYYYIYKYLLTTDLKDMAIKANENFEAMICDLYINNNFTQADIGKQFCMTRNQILAILRKNNLRKSDKSLDVYDYDIRFFDNIDTSEKAYILGLIASDGCLPSSNPSIKISLQESDKMILEKIHDIIGIKNELKYELPKFRGPQCRLTIYSKYMYYSLIDKGITPRKSLTLKYPNCIPDKFQSDFIRGYFDGDGTLTSTKKKFAPMVQILGTEDFISNMITIIQKHTGLTCHMYKSKDSDITKRLSISGRFKVKIFLDWLYSSNSELYIKRKHDRYLQYFYSGINNSQSA